MREDLTFNSVTYLAYKRGTYVKNSLQIDCNFMYTVAINELFVSLKLELKKYLIVASFCLSTCVQISCCLTGSDVQSLAS
jgi:hypothetical protein